MVVVGDRSRGGDFGRLVVVVIVRDVPEYILVAVAYSERLHTQTTRFRERLRGAYHKDSLN